MSDRDLRLELAEFITWRQEWLTVDRARNRCGTYDVVLRLDGSYPLAADADALADSLRQELERLLPGAVEAVDRPVRLADWHERPYRRPCPREQEPREGLDHEKRNYDREAGR
jgi:hypothetical protein